MTEMNGNGRKVDIAGLEEIFDISKDKSKNDSKETVNANINKSDTLPEINKNYHSSLLIVSSIVIGSLYLAWHAYNESYNPIRIDSVQIEKSDLNSKLHLKYNNGDILTLYDPNNTNNFYHLKDIMKSKELELIKINANEYDRITKNLNNSLELYLNNLTK